MLEIYFANDYINENFLNILDSIFYNCTFFSFNLGIVIFVIRSCHKTNNIRYDQSHDYNVLSNTFDDIKKYFKFSLSVFYLIHIILNYKLFITDFLFTLFDMLSNYHFDFLYLTVPVIIVFLFFKIIKNKLS